MHMATREACSFIFQPVDEDWAQLRDIQKLLMLYMQIDGYHYMYTVIPLLH